MLNEEDPVHAAIPPGRTAGRTAARLPSPRLTFTGRFRAGKAPEVLVTALPCLPRRRRPTRGCGSQHQKITLHHPDISFRGPQALKVRTGMSVR